MQNCPSRDELHRVLLSDLEPPRQNLLYEHIEQCPGCQQALDALCEEQATWIDVADAATDTQWEPALSALVSRLGKQSPAEPADASMGAAPQNAAAEQDFLESATEQAPLGVLGPYWLQRQIGRGASGVLYEALDSHLNRRVAVKVLRGELAESESGRARLAREARAVAQLSHPHVVTLFQMAEEASQRRPYLVMELVEGQSLRETLAERPTLPPQDAARVARDVARGLAAAHERNLVHRDIKPANILLEAESGRAKVADFGLARGDDGSNRITVEGALAGTPAYMSPEQIADPDQVDARSDVYSTGVVLYEMLAGRPPFEGDIRETLIRILHHPPAPLEGPGPKIPADLQTICNKALAKDPADRYPSAKALAEDLSRFLDGKPIAGRLRSSRPGPLLAVVACCVAVGAIGLIVWWSGVFDGNSTATNGADSNNPIAENFEQEMQNLLLDSLLTDFVVPDDFDPAEKTQREIDQVAVATTRDALAATIDRAVKRGAVDPPIVEAQLRVAELEYARNRDDAAQKALVRATQLLDRLPKTKTEDAWEHGDLEVRILFSRATMLEQQAKPEQALQRLQRAMKIARRRQEISRSIAAESDFLVELDVALAEGFLARNAAARGARKDAIERWSRCAKLLAEIAALEEEPQALYDRLNIHWLLAEHYLQAKGGDRTQAVDHLKQCLVAADGLLDTEPAPEPGTPPKADAASESASPVQASPVQASPVQADPVQADPVQADPVQADPVQADPVQADPVQPPETYPRLQHPPYQLFEDVPLDDRELLYTASICHWRLAAEAVRSGQYKQAETHAQKGRRRVQTLCDTYPEHPKVLRQTRAAIEALAERFSDPKAARARDWLKKALADFQAADRSRTPQPNATQPKATHPEPRRSPQNSDKPQ